MKYINIHSHRLRRKDETCITNLFAQNAIEDSIDDQQYYSIGFHPWHIGNENIELFGKTIMDAMIHPSVVAIGETGLDKAIDIPIEKQEEVLIKHVELAEENNCPIIIHCVKAYNELIKIRKELNPLQPWILHGYYGNSQITEQLLKYNFYFSFGESLADPSEKLAKSISIIPVDKIFLETDESELCIREIYKYYGSIKGIEITRLCARVENNFRTCFDRL